MKTNWFDIGHSAQFNFFKQTILNLLQNNNNILITAINRGRLVNIIKKELKEIQNCNIYAVGNYKSNKVSVIWDANVTRFFQLIIFFLKHKPDIQVGNGYLAGLVAKLFNIPSIQFGDDPDRLDYRLKVISSTELYYALSTTTKCKCFNALKEWAYLSPKYFTPAIKELSNYNLRPQGYIFIREVSTGSLNYANQQSNMIATFARDLPHNYHVLLSLEDKSTINQYPSNWILLKEPLNDIHSLIYYSKILISSGDSMAREGAMLGVPSIYCGIREMAANKVMIDKGMLFHKDVKEVPQFIERIISSDIKIEEQDKFRERLENEWIDVTQFIIRQIKKYG